MAKESRDHLTMSDRTLGEKQLVLRVRQTRPEAQHFRHFNTFVTATSSVE
jgi:hypothetical protein